MKKVFLLLILYITVNSCYDSMYMQCPMTNVKAPSGFKVNQLVEKENFRNFDFHFLDANIGFIYSKWSSVGYNLFSTVNGGQSWNGLYLRLKIDQRIQSLAVMNSEVAVISIDNIGVSNSAILKSEDLGKNWSIAIPSSILSDNEMIRQFSVEGGKTHVLTSLGSLITFDSQFGIEKRINLESENLVSVDVINDNVFVALYTDQLLKSDDKGQNWFSIFEGRCKVIGFSSENEGHIIFDKGFCDTAYETYKKGVIASTIDGGFSWTEAEEESTNLFSNFNKAEYLGNEKWIIGVDDALHELTRE